MQIIQYLGPMLGQQARDSLYFNDDLVVADEIRHIFLLESGAPIGQLKPLLLHKGNTPMSELQGQALLVHGFQKPRPHGRVYIKQSTPRLSHSSHQHTAVIVWVSETGNAPILFVFTFKNSLFSTLECTQSS
jgi:hypothetical protein